MQFEEPAEGRRKPSTGAPRKDDTPLTMAMRQAGAEAAAKAGQKKVVKPGSLMSDNPTSPDVPTPSTALDTKLSKASEEPHASAAEMTAAKTPAVLAAEGAKRSSVDKIADSESSTDGESESPKSREETLLQARRTSSIVKKKTSLSNETALDSTPALPVEQQAVEERPRTHRGSSVSEASREEIEGVEKAQAIPEEDEGDEGEARVQEREEEKRKKEKGQASTDEVKPSLADVTSSDKQEQPSEPDNKSSAPDAKEEEAAGVSVGD